MAYLIGIALFIFGCSVGLSSPDVDQNGWKPLLLHRSILTHSALLPLLLFVLLRPVLFRHPLSVAGRLFLIGLSFSLAIHLCFDMYPTRWWGFALIHIPFNGWTTPGFSKNWLLGTVAICLILGCWLIRSMGEFVVSLLGLIVLYGMVAAREPQDSFYVLVWVLPISFFAFVLSRHRNDPDDPATRLRRLMQEP